MKIIILLFCCLAIIGAFIIQLYRIARNPKIILPAILREYGLFKELSYNYPTDKLHRLMMIDIVLPKIADTETKNSLLAIREDVCREIDRRDYFENQKQTL